MKSINTSIYTFENIINEDCLYVDKTEYFYKLVTKKRGQFFMSRPRRFGKSLAISTLDAIFRGKRELLTSYFAGFPYDIQIKAEKYYRSMVRVIFEMCGMEFRTEEKFFA